MSTTTIAPLHLCDTRFESLDRQEDNKGFTKSTVACAGTCALSHKQRLNALMFRTWSISAGSFCFGLPDLCACCGTLLPHCCAYCSSCNAPHSFWLAVYLQSRWLAELLRSLHRSRIENASSIIFLMNGSATIYPAVLPEISCGSVSTNCILDPEFVSDSSAAFKLT